MEVRRVKIVDPRAMKILRVMQDRGWIVIEAVEDNATAEEAAGAQRMTDEEFENFATELLAR